MRIFRRLILAALPLMIALPHAVAQDGVPDDMVPVDVTGDQGFQEDAKPARDPARARKRKKGKKGGVKKKSGEGKGKKKRAY